jgi:dipeptide/tripeptide permease
VQQAALFGALGVIALGTGGIKPNVSAFGADQFDEKDPQDKREKESFFNWFYLAINIGRCARPWCAGRNRLRGQGGD